MSSPVVPADNEGIARAAEAIRAGRVVAYRTDTVYALAADPRNSEALSRLVAIKGRAPGKPSPLIAADTAQVEMLAELNDIAVDLAAAFWPGPLTMILRARDLLSPTVMNERSGIGLRVPASDSARRLAMACDSAITATSANISGEESPRTAPAIAASLAVDLVLDGGPVSSSVPSTVVDVSGARVVLIREGAIAKSAIGEMLGDELD